MIFRSNMILIAILILLAGLVAGSIESNLHKVFSGDWLSFDDPQESKGSNVEMDNSEFDYGHNVEHTSDDE